jgi:sugar O-acyltransferase (sialic acid O-acetyltransferase NeuD family)
MIKKEIILIGGGGHCISCIDVIEQEGKYKIAGIIDLKENIGKKILNYPIIGSDDELEKFSSEYNYFAITIGQIKSSDKRVELYEKLKKLSIQLPIIISPKSYVSKHANIEEGTIIMHGIIINAKAQIGVNCIINTNSLIEHEVKIGNHCHISTNTVINGQVTIGNKCTLGSGAIIKNNITITNNVIVGAGSVVVKNINDSGTYIGVPAKIKRN